MKRSIAIAAIIVLLSIFSAYAEITVEEYERELKGDEAFEMYMNGLSRGIGWANASVKERCGKPLYCLPEKMVLETGDFTRILDDYIEHKRKTGVLKPSDYIGLLLLYGLEKTFPCK